MRVGTDAREIPRGARRRGALYFARAAWNDGAASTNVEAKKGRAVEGRRGVGRVSGGRAIGIAFGAAVGGLVVVVALAFWALGADRLWSEAGAWATQRKVALPFAARLRVAEADARLGGDAQRLDEVRLAGRVHAADPAGAARAALARGDTRLVGVFAGWGVGFPAVRDAERERVARERGCRFCFTLSDAGDRLLLDECVRYAETYNAEILRSPASSASSGSKESIPLDVGFIASPCGAETSAGRTAPPNAARTPTAARRHGG